MRTIIFFSPVSLMLEKKESWQMGCFSLSSFPSFKNALTTVHKILFVIASHHY